MPDYGRGKRPMDQPTRQEERMRENRDAIRRALDKLTNPTMRMVVERGERVARGTREGEAGRGGKGEVPRPTERVALEGLPDDEDSPDVWRERADAVGKAIRELASLLDHARVTMEAAEDKLLYVLNVRVEEFELLGEHKTAALCRACQRKVTGSADDRLREGYCNACRMAWKRLQEAWTDRGRPSAPDRLAFERDRLVRAEREEREAS